MPVLYGVKPAAPFFAELESRIGFGIPVEYANFLKKWNGLFVSGADYLDLDFSGVDNGLISFSSLFGLAASNDIGFAERSRFSSSSTTWESSSGVCITGWRGAQTNY
ncbi:hypothetical protein [Burkholderia cepacia]|uniref:hypothetical protein n=1 Tax=Burkholderia cepacia TaxID=292 RepID=UPI000A578622|nr:hypothetical protein [Burkholderia cepacia]